MTPYLFWELLFLGIGVWVLALILVVYAWVLLRRQKQFFEAIVARFESMTENKSPRFTLNDLRPSLKTEKSLVIAKDEPISKYADMTVSDSVNVSFVDAHDDENT